jgi:hypothetical protein
MWSLVALVAGALLAAAAAFLHARAHERTETQRLERLAKHPCLLLLFRLPVSLLQATTKLRTPAWLNAR